MENAIGKQLGSGGTSNVYEWGDHEVIKIFKPHITDDTIHNEMYIGQLLNNHSLEIPRFISSIIMNGKKALIYERVTGKTMAEPFLNGIIETEIAIKFAQMHYNIHNIKINELPSQHDFLKNRILELRDILKDKTDSLLRLLDRIPNDHKLCHGDYHPLNIIGEANKYYVIDWNGACSGNPVLDVAWSYMTLNSPAIKHVLGDAISDIFANFINDYISCYCKLSGIKQENIIECLPIVVARRLYDNNMYETEISRLEKEWLFDLIQTI